MNGGYLLYEFPELINIGAESLSARVEIRKLDNEELFNSIKTILETQKPTFVKLDFALANKYIGSITSLYADYKYVDVGARLLNAKGNISTENLNITLDINISFNLYDIENKEYDYFYINVAGDLSQ